MAHLLEADWKELWNGSEVSGPKGAVYTKSFVVEFILDLVEYDPDHPLSNLRLLEPACGDGVFVNAIVRRLIISERQHSPEVAWSNPNLDLAITATDIDGYALGIARDNTRDQLVSSGCPHERAEQLVGRWFKHTDFLLEIWIEQFDIIVGNPPYVRIEALPKIVLSRYRSLYTTASDRADLYVPFIERSLELLSQSGTLAFICANRFTKNKYGTALRRLIAAQYHVKYYLNLEHTQPFLSAVSAYPAIIVIDRNQGQATFAATADGELEQYLNQLKMEVPGNEKIEKFNKFQNWYRDGGPWVATSVDKSRDLETLQKIFPTLEHSAPNTRVGIGVATGSDNIFILPGFRPDIEGSRQIPIVLATDVDNRGIFYSGHYVINPFNDDGHLVHLAEFPGLARYLERHRTLLAQRHVARTRPKCWYRTIDRIWPQWQFMPKLLIPDIRGTAVIGLDSGKYYPHHNLYWVTSDWPLNALKSILRSTSVHKQVQAYSVQMRGGHLRFQAQTLRKIRIPALQNLDENILNKLSTLSECDSQAELDEIVNQALAQHTQASRLLL